MCLSVNLSCRYDTLISNEAWVGRGLRISWEAAQREQGIRKICVIREAGTLAPGTIRIGFMKCCRTEYYR